jgi:hypothetical protein
MGKNPMDYKAPRACHESIDRVLGSSLYKDCPKSSRHLRMIYSLEERKFFIYSSDEEGAL